MPATMASHPRTFVTAAHTCIVPEWRGGGKANRAGWVTGIHYPTGRGRLTAWPSQTSAPISSTPPVSIRLTRPLWIGLVIAVFSVAGGSCR